MPRFRPFDPVGEHPSDMSEDFSAGEAVEGGMKYLPVVVLRVHIPEEQDTVMPGRALIHLHIMPPVQVELDPHGHGHLITIENHAPSWEVFRSEKRAAALSGIISKYEMDISFWLSPGPYRPKVGEERPGRPRGQKTDTRPDHDGVAFDLEHVHQDLQVPVEWVLSQIEVCDALRAGSTPRVSQRA